MVTFILAHKKTVKNSLMFIVFTAGFGFQIDVFGQAIVQISGTVKSKQGAVQQAQVEFFNLNDNFLGNSISGTNGRFRSEGKMAVGKPIRIKISMKGYKTLVKDVQINSTGNVGEFLLERGNLIISGFVRDSISGLVLPDVEISFYNDQGKLITAKSKTDSRGYFDLETDFVFGQKITVRAFKKGYYDDKEYTQTFSSEGKTSLPDILLPEIGDRGLRAFIRVKNKRTGKPVGGANVHFLDRKKSKYIDSLVPSSGELELKLYQRPGTTLDMLITKPNYHNIQANPTLSEDPQTNKFDYPMEKVGRSSLGPILLIGSGAAALASGGMYLASKKQYDDYKNDLVYPDRENDRKSAESKRTISAIAGGVAAAALVGYVITRVQERNNERRVERNRIRTSFLPTPSSNRLDVSNIPIIGMAYRF